MAKIYELRIKNFRGIKEFKHTFHSADLICLIGRGDSGKSTILESLSAVLSPNWNLTFFDSDFYNCDTKMPIEIEATLVDLPKNLISENKFGLHIRGIDIPTGEIKDELANNHEIALTIKLEVKRDLEPKWYVINARQDSPISISAINRAKLNVFMISDYVDRHFSWNKGNPLYSLLKQRQGDTNSESSIEFIEALREAKSKIDNTQFEQFEGIISAVKLNAAGLGVDISNTSTSIDFKDISVKEGRVCLHDANIPFRLKGKGSKRLISLAIQTTLADHGGIILLDEVEQGLEPDRVKHLTRTLGKKTKGQIFLSTHSQNVIEEIDVNCILRVKNSGGIVKCLECDERYQNVIRACPEAMYAERVIVCEGKTEIGICRALDEYRIKQGKPNLSANNVVYTLGEGSSHIERALKLRNLGLEICVLCDSDDDDNLHPSKKELANNNIKVIDWEHKNAIEDQVFRDLPPAAILELIHYMEGNLSRESIKQSVESILNQSLEANWEKIDLNAKREALGKVAKKNKWFKRIDHGQFLGTVIFKYLKEIQNKTLGTQLSELSSWIDDV